MTHPSGDRPAKTEWHRLFGLFCHELLTPAGWRVEIEHDLSLRRQRLDVLVVRGRAAALPDPLPDGLENLRPHNLITYKSHNEPLDEWALKELTSYYVNYRKQISPSFNQLLPESEFGLYGVCCREPQKLAGELVLTRLGEGIYETHRGGDRFRIIVTSQVSDDPRNHLWHLFSAQSERVSRAASAFRQHGLLASTFVDKLYQYYQLEGLSMPYTVEDFQREYLREHVDLLTPEERLAGLAPEEIAKRLSPEERLTGLTPEEMEKLRQLMEQKASPQAQTQDPSPQADDAEEHQD